VGYEFHCFLQGGPQYGTLGIQPSFLMGRLFEKLPGLHSLSLVAYFALPLLVALIYVEQLRLDKKRAFITLLIFFFGMVIGASCYNLYPACGPISLLLTRISSFAA
jgi:hypothetical protein